MSEKIRILIADDHTILRAGLRLLFEGEPDLDVVGEAADGAQAIALVEALHPQVVLMDVAMPGINGLEATRQIKARWPEVAVLVLTMHRSDEYFFEIVRTGASGYVLKNADTGELVEALRQVARGGVFFYQDMTKRLLHDYLHLVREVEDGGTPKLSVREREILCLIVEGYSNKEIALRLLLSPSTVHSHHANIMKKLNLSSQHDLVQYARQHGLMLDEAR